MLFLQKKGRVMKKITFNKIKKYVVYRLYDLLISIFYKLLFIKRPVENLIYYNQWKYYSLLKLFYNKKIDKSFEIIDESTPKIIWWCWLQGEQNAPDISLACLASLRKNLSNFEIKIVTEKNMFDFICIPDYIKEKYEKGIISKTHFSDILRTCLLVEYGGTWIDSTVYCTGYRIDVLSLPLFFFSNIKRGDEGIALSNWMITSCKNHPVLLNIRALLFDYWRKSNHLYHYFIYHFFATMVLDKYQEIKANVPVFSNIPPHIMQFELFSIYSEERFKQFSIISDFHKLTYKSEQYNDIKGSVYEYIINNR